MVTIFLDDPEFYTAVLQRDMLNLTFYTSIPLYYIFIGTYLLLMCIYHQEQKYPVLTSCCVTVLGTSKGIFDREEDVLINKQKISHLSLLTLTSYVLQSLLFIFKISVGTYISIDTIYDTCVDHSTCVIFNNITEKIQATTDCSVIDDDNMLIGCVKVTYKQNEAFALAGGLLTITRIIPQVTATIVLKIIALISKLTAPFRPHNQTSSCEKKIKQILQAVLKVIQIGYAFLSFFIITIIMEFRVGPENSMRWQRFYKTDWIITSVLIMTVIICENSLRSDETNDDKKDDIKELEKEDDGTEKDSLIRNTDSGEETDSETKNML